MGRNPALPAFFTEALELEGSLDLSVLDLLPELLQPMPPERRLAERLSSEVRELPLRYAPFFDSLTALWDLSEPEVREVLSRARNASAWKRAPFPGIRWLPVSAGPQTQGAEVRLLQLAPGTRFPRHRHPGPELILVLEGSYRDSQGRRVVAGETQRMEPGTEHAFAVDKTSRCVAASVQHGMEFTGLALRLLSRLFA